MAGNLFLPLALAKIMLQLSFWGKKKLRTTPQVRMTTCWKLRVPNTDDAHAGKTDFERRGHALASETYRENDSALPWTAPGM